MNQRIFQSGILVAVLFCGCAGKTPPPPAPPGYTGPLPSGAGQTAMHALSGKTFLDSAGVSRAVSGYMVGPSGAMVNVQEGTVTRIVLLESDGDVANFHLRMTGTAHPTLSGTPSGRYLQSWK